MTKASPTQTAPSSWSRHLSTVLPVLLLFAVGAFAVWRVSNGPSLPDPVKIEASGPVFTTIDELVAASDVIVEGRIVSVDSGRTITDPADPATGFTTALFQLNVTASYHGANTGSLIVEQEAALLDGTPIVVNDLRPHRVGDTGFWFLVRGNDDEFPYVALVNEQARLLVDGADRPVEPFEGFDTASAVRARIAKLTNDPIAGHLDSAEAAR
jgi:hypothetical protein